MEELNNLIESLNLDELDYYYHITGSGFGADIIENGLYLEEPDLKTTTIKLPEELLNDPEEYCLSEYNNSIVKRNEMVIIGCDRGEGNEIIFKADEPKWVGDQKLTYFIRPENILGYIDLETLDVVYNSEYMDFGYRR